MKKLIRVLSILFIPLIVVALLQGCSKEKGEDNKLTEGKDEALAGKILWKFKTDGSILSTPVIYENNIIFGSNDKKIYAVDLDTQEEKWSFESDGFINNTPIIDGNTLIFSSRYAGTTCYALDAKTGKEIWKYTSQVVAEETLGGWDYHSPSPILYKDLVILPNKSGNIYGINKADGKMLWEFKAEDSSDIITTPAIQGDILCFGDIKGRAFAVDLNTQKTIWSNKIGSKVIHTAFIYKDYAYFAGRDIVLRAYDLKTGSEKWSYTDEQQSWLTGDIIAKDDIIYVPGSDNCKVQAFKYDNGEAVSSYLGKGNIFSKPTINNGVLYFSAGDANYSKLGSLSAYDLDNNTKLLENSFDFPIYSSPLVHNGVIYFGGTDQNLYALEATSK